MKQTFLGYICLFFSLLVLPPFAKADSYPEVLFENSALPYSYSNSRVEYHGDSWIKNMRKQLPLSDSIYFTPNNALSLNYMSGLNGGWEAKISYPEAYVAPRNAALIFKLYIQSDTKVGELPAILLQQSDSTISEKVRIGDYLNNVQEDTWLSIEIPLRKIGGFREDVGISEIRFVQQGKDGKLHQLYLDQIEVLPQKTPQNKLTGAAVLHTITPFEQHVDVSWRLPLTSSIRYIKIYRSENNVDFEPIAIRPVFASKYTDIIPEVGKLYYYKIAWVDYQYRESPFSTVKEVKTKVLNNEELLNMVHQSNIQYFIDGMEFNSGMQQLRMSGKDATVSTKLTGLGIMALISGVQQKMISREQFISRMQKIVAFIGNVETYHGAFPALMDGRSGKGVYHNATIHSVDLNATSYLIQGLLVAQQYLDHNNEVEAALRTKISNVWHAVQWNAFLKPGVPYLFTNWSVEEGFANARPLLGRDALSTYLIALSSTSYNIELTSYHQALNFVNNADTAIVQDVEPVSYNGIDSVNTADTLLVQLMDPPLKMVEVEKQGSYYGLPFNIGNPEGALDRFLAALLVFDSKGKHDEYANYYKEVQNLILIQNRRSLEENHLPVSLSKGLIVNPQGLVDPSTSVATYSFHPDFAVNSLVAIYRDYPALFWSEYGFRTIDMGKNKVRYDLEGMHHGISAIMIENGKSNLIWNLFSKNQDIMKAVDVLFQKD